MHDTSKALATLLVNSFAKIGVDCAIDTSDIRNITVDPTIWDLEIKSLIADPSFTSLSWADAYGDVAWSNEEVQGVYNWCFIHDDKLEEYNVVGATVAGYSQELIEEARNYVIFEQCYQLMLTSANNYYASRTDTVSELVCNYASYPVPQACIYKWN